MALTEWYPTQRQGQREKCLKEFTEPNKHVNNNSCKIAALVSMLGHNETTAFIFLTRLGSLSMSIKGEWIAYALLPCVFVYVFEFDTAGVG